MDIYSPQGDELFQLLLFSVAAMFFTERIIHISMDKAAGGYTLQRDICTRIVNNNWFLFGFQLFATGVSIIPALTKYSPEQIEMFLSGLRTELPGFG